MYRQIRKLLTGRVSSHPCMVSGLSQYSKASYLILTINCLEENLCLRLFVANLKYHSTYSANH